MGNPKKEAHAPMDHMDRLQAVQVKNPVRNFFYPEKKKPVVKQPENIKAAV